jgi:hypothetical protein
LLAGSGFEVAARGEEQEAATASQSIKDAP